MSGAAGEKFRAFIAIRIGSNALERVHRIQRCLADRLSSGAVQWAAPDQIHLTLQFLGNVPAGLLDPLTLALRDACRKISPFGLATGGLGCFPNDRAPRILWVGLHGDLEALADLQRSIAEKVVPFIERAESRPFHPHLTIGRIKHPDRKTTRLLGRLIKEVTLPSVDEWRVQEIELIKSEISSLGAVHTPLHMIGLSNHPGCDER
jgi:2'-5' RNA ligase